MASFLPAFDARLSFVLFFIIFCIGGLSFQQRNNLKFLSFFCCLEILMEPQVGSGGIPIKMMSRLELCLAVGHFSIHLLMFSAKSKEF